LKFCMFLEQIIGFLSFANLTHYYLCNHAVCILSQLVEKINKLKIYLISLGKIYTLYQLMRYFVIHRNMWVKQSTPQVPLIWYTWLDYRSSLLLYSGSWNCQVKHKTRGEKVEMILRENYQLNCCKLPTKLLFYELYFHAHVPVHIYIEK
jgi:hypothetical protein